MTGIVREVTIGPCRLIQGDCRECFSFIGSCDVLITDPPYGVAFDGKATKHTRATHENRGGGYLSGDSDIGPLAVSEFLPLVKRGVVFPGNRLAFKYPEPYDIGCVYCPSGAGLGRYGFVVMHIILYYGMGLPHSRQGPSGFQSFATQPENGHPCPKPIEWMNWAIQKSSKKTETILDIFMGSGTTGVSCIQEERQFIGIEREPKYFDIAAKRITQAWDLKRSELKFDEPDEPKFEQSLLFRDPE